MSDQIEGTCRLCGNWGRLCNSHIIPKLAPRHLAREGFLGTLHDVRDRLAPLHKKIARPLLCKECEQRFNRYESPFTDKLFIPFLKGELPDRLRVDDWLLRFAVSIAWRVGVDKREVFLNMYPSQIANLDNALNDWGEYLLERQSDPGIADHLHILFLDPAAMMLQFNLSADEFFYARGLQKGLMHVPPSALAVYENLGGIYVVSFVPPSQPGTGWNNSRIPSSGVVDLTARELPDTILNSIRSGALLVTNERPSLRERYAGREKFQKALMKAMVSGLPEHREVGEIVADLKIQVRDMESELRAEIQAGDVSKNFGLGLLLYNQHDRNWDARQAFEAAIDAGVSVGEAHYYRGILFGAIRALRDQACDEFGKAEALGITEATEALDELCSD